MRRKLGKRIVTDTRTADEASRRRLSGRCLHCQRRRPLRNESGGSLRTNRHSRVPKISRASAGVCTEAKTGGRGSSDATDPPRMSCCNARQSSASVTASLAAAAASQARNTTPLATNAVARIVPMRLCFRSCGVASGSTTALLYKPNTPTPRISPMNAAGNGAKALISRPPRQAITATPSAMPPIMRLNLSCLLSDAATCPPP